MKNIVRVFRPWLDAHPEVDVYLTDDNGCVCVSTIDGEPIIRPNVDRRVLLMLITAWFFDQVVTKSWHNAAFRVLDDMQPYLDQLPEKDVDTIHTILGLFLKFNEEHFPCTGPALS